MFEWLRNLFASFSKTNDAGDRIAKATEDMADMMEQARDQLRARLGHVPAAPAALTVEAPAEEAPRHLSPSNGRRKQPAAG